MQVLATVLFGIPVALAISLVDIPDRTIASSATASYARLTAVSPCLDCPM
jgi:hypothetical protein